VNNIIHGKEEAILKICREGHVLKPYLDDLAQIAGVNIKCLKDSEDNINKIAKELKNKNAILIEGIGALCTGITESEAEAVDMVLNKGCIADIYGTRLNLSPLGSLDANIQRIIYVKKYSKQKDKEV
jgi:L-fuculose-phosphate aldolase